MIFRLRETRRTVILPTGQRFVVVERSRGGLPRFQHTPGPAGADPGAPRSRSDEALLHAIMSADASTCPRTEAKAAHVRVLRARGRR